MFRVFLYCGIAIFLSTSCSSYSRCQSNKTRLIKDMPIENAREEALSECGFISGPWPEDDWWYSFKDDQLTAFIESGLKENSSLKSVEANVRATHERALAVRSHLFPQIGAVFSLIWQYLNPNGVGKFFPLFDPNFQFYDLGGTFNYEFDFWGKNLNQYLASLGESKTEKARLCDAKRILSTAIALQYLQLQSNMVKFEILLEVLAKKSKILELNQMRRINRLSSLIDLNQVKEEILIFQQAIAGLKGELELEKSLLATLMGKNPDEDFPIKLVWMASDKPFQLPKNIGLHLLTRRPDLMAQIWLVEAAAKNVGVAIANFYPNVNLAGFLGLASFSFPQLFKGSAFLPAMMPLMKMPIFEGGKLKANLRGNTARFEALVHSFNDALLKAANEVVSGMAKLQAANEKLQFQTENVRVSQENYALVSIRYQNGIDSMISLLKSDERYLMTKLQKTELEWERYRTTIELIKALGGGFEDKEGDTLREKYG